MTAHPQSIDSALALDASDPLAGFRARFAIPDGLIYLDGNSLGMLPRHAPERVRAVVEEEWGRQLIRGWTAAGWITLPRRVGARIAALIGADEDEVVCADSTSVNLFKVLSAALALRPERRKIVSTADNFPTDLYIAQGLTTLLADGHTLATPPADALLDAIDDDTAAMLLTHVNFKSGLLFDMATITAAAHARGALIIWDLAHSAGALPVDLRSADADFAIGCGYKYLNGGPGAPAFVYAARRHHNRATQPLTGWLGHADPFAFSSAYEPARGIDQFVCGTPPVLSLAALECGVELMQAAGLDAIRAKSMALTDLFIARVEARCDGHGLTLISPRDAARRGSQVSFAHPDGYAIMQALIADGVIGDFRAPDIMRFGFAPLYNSYADVWRAADALADVLATRRWDRPEFKTRKAVT
jgi:kynureninase